MKIKDILNESCTDLVAKYYVEASEEFEEHYNGEAHFFADKNKEYYDKYFKEWFEDGKVPVFDKPITPAQPPYRHNPKKGDPQSPGYRGKQYALARAGLPYDHNVHGFNSKMKPYGIGGP